MPNAEPTHYRHTVVLLTPTGRDAALIADAFERFGIAAQACADSSALVQKIAEGADAVVIAEEAISPKVIGDVAEALRKQPPWSDLPVIVLSRDGGSARHFESGLEILAPLGNVAVVERPVHPATLRSVVTAALRARERQYQLERLLNELEVTEERLRTMVESVKDYAIINLDLSGRVTYWNTGAQRLLGYHESEMIGETLERIFTREDRETGLPVAEIHTALRAGRAESEGWRIRRDGTRFWASGVVSPTRNRDDAITGVVKVLRDITERNEAEERLAQQAKALQESNEDLRRFAYAASHDLQEPLRMIASYTQLLLRKCEGKLDEDSKQFSHYIVTGVERMLNLIRELLDYSRLTEQPGQPVTPVDANTTLGLALQQLQFKIAQSRAAITFDRLPLVLVHGSALVRVFQNLIGNALKYCEKTPQIHIWAEREDGHWRIAVRDNGIGIAPRHHERIFGLFQRLHSSAEYAGSGIGLATCKRIVEQAGGRIWVESSEGGGSTFYFTLPAAEVASESKIAR